VPDIEQIATDPDPYAPYRISQAIRHGDLVYVSGQAAIDESGALVGVGDFDTQAEQAFRNLERVLYAAGSGLDRIVKVTIFLTDMSNFPKIVELRGRWFSEPYPADTIVEVSSLALPELEIVSLIAGGTTRSEIQGRSQELAQAVSSERLFQSGAASILFDLLQQRVGNRLGLLGTGRVRIDPFLVGSNNNPGARITLSEQLTNNLAVTYSQDIASNRQQVILIKYFFSRNTSIVASRDEYGNFGLDLRQQKRFK